MMLAAAAERWPGAVGAEKRYGTKLVTSGLCVNLCSEQDV
jgi:hypothetical protein